MEPKICPFCKSENCDIAIEKSFFGGMVNTYVFCECGVEGPHKSTETVSSLEFEDLESEDVENYLVELAVNAWNNRE
jgi:hypothetical protein